MPPPMISSRFGTSASSSAPVESMRRLSSYGKPGMRADCEPAAMMQWSNETVFDAFLGLDREQCAARRTGRVPSTTVTLRALARPPRPLGQLADHAVLELAQPVEIDLRLAERRGRSALLSSASVITFAACSSAFDGMQPTFRQTPPSAGSARPARPSCRGRPRGTPRCSRRGRSPAPAPRRGGRRRGARAAPVPGATAGARGRARAPASCAGGGGAGGFCGVGSALRRRASARLRRCRRRRAFRGLEHSDHRALRHPIADLHLQLLDRARAAARAPRRSPCRDSSVTSGASFATTSPGFTRISMTGMSLKSPMSGTVISTGGHGPRA